MEINLYGTQWNVDSRFESSHLLTQEIEKSLVSNLGQIGDYSILGVYISARIDEVNETKIDFRVKKTKQEIELFVFLPHAEIKSVGGHVFNPKKFDFEYKENAFKVYPVLSYVKFVFTGLKSLFQELKPKLEIELDGIESKLVSLISEKIETYYFRSEEILHLQEIIDRSHWAYKENSDWFESEIGQKWIALASKYRVMDNGSIVLRDED